MLRANEHKRCTQDKAALVPNTSFFPSANKLLIIKHSVCLTLCSHGVITCFGACSGLVHGRNYSGRQRLVAGVLSALLSASRPHSVSCSACCAHQDGWNSLQLCPKSSPYSPRRWAFHQSPTNSNTDRDGISILMRSVRFHIHCLSHDCHGIEMTHVPIDEWRILKMGNIYSEALKKRPHHIGEHEEIYTQ